MGHSHGESLLFVNLLDEVGWLRGCIRAQLPGLSSPDQSWANAIEKWRRELLNARQPKQTKVKP